MNRAGRLRARGSAQAPLQELLERPGVDEVMLGRPHEPGGDLLRGYWAKLANGPPVRWANAEFTIAWPHGHFTRSRGSGNM